MQLTNSETAITRPLCVDLDGTLVRTDTLIEALMQLVRRNPLTLLLLPIWAASGRVRLKREVARRLILDAAELPYDEAFLGYLRAEKARGRHLVLVTATDAVQATAVAEHLGLFDEVIASDGATNLKSTAKAAALIATLRRRRFRLRRQRDGGHAGMAAGRSGDPGQRRERRRRQDQGRAPGRARVRQPAMPAGAPTSMRCGSTSG